MKFDEQNDLLQEMQNRYSVSEVVNRHRNRYRYMCIYIYRIELHGSTDIRISESGSS